MTSDEKTLAFLARRVSALEKKSAVLEEAIALAITNQSEFKPVIQDIFKGIQLNGQDHEKILKHLGIE